MRTFADKTYWDNHWYKNDFHVLDNKHPIKKWIIDNINETDIGNCIEVGCYPGKFLALFGEMGYSINGIDICNRITDMNHWFISKKYKIGEINNCDFLKYKIIKNFDLVCSFGFIEHFDNWEKLIDKHIAMTKKGGKCIIEIPNLNSIFYKILYKTFEPDVLKGHNLAMMSLNKIRSHFEKQGCMVIKSEYVGHCFFRFVKKHDKQHRLLSKVINMIIWPFNLLPKSVSARYICVLAEK